ncbi:hypothetical protein PanWU01x14_088260 [Parasponia andersonii]|uniref:Uncharacterized protein n=1 Tax=Parasponia andersonii TaxID=3476 RepID=A0A2P5D7X2_PARAD|nr:hypothetical protein PanWU01x14_088260 [Parasponia andersonii]
MPSIESHIESEGHTKLFYNICSPPDCSPGSATRACNPSGGTKVRGRWIKLLGPDSSGGYCVRLASQNSEYLPLLAVEG